MFTSGSEQLAIAQVERRERGAAEARRDEVPAPRRARAWSGGGGGGSAVRGGGAAARGAPAAREAQLFEAGAGLPVEVENPHLWAGLRRAAEATASLQAAQAALWGA